MNGRGRKQERHYRYKEKPLRALLARLRWRRTLPVLACLALVIYGGARLIGYMTESRAAARVGEAARALHDAPTPAVSQPPAQSPPPAQAAAPAPMPTAIVTEKRAYQYIGASVLPEMQRLKKQNRDTVGWISIPGVVDLPVVYRDNSYYLTHGFDGAKNSSGALFLDKMHPVTARTQYLVIHGHNMRDGGMFGMLPHYSKLAYMHEHGIVSFSTLYRKETYVAFAVLTVSESVRSPDYVAYTGTPTFDSEARFNAFLAQITERSLYRVPVEVDASDALLTLSTCLDEGHIIVVCRRLRDGETEDSARAALARSVRR